VSRSDCSGDRDAVGCGAMLRSLLYEAANNALSDPERPKPKGAIMKQAGQSAGKDFADNPVPGDGKPGGVDPNAGIRQHINPYVTPVRLGLSRIF